MKIADISIRQPVFITMVIGAIVVIGLVAYSMIAVDLFPDISLPLVAVTTFYPGTGPEEMETQVTKPIEEGVSALAGVEKVSSTSSEGVSVVIVEFKLETDPRRAATDVRDRIASIRSKLPREIQEPVIDKFDPAVAPIIAYGIASLAMPLERLRTTVEDDIKPQLERIDGVASVEIIGGVEREMQVNVDYSRMRARSLTTLQIAQALRAENLNLPAGRLAEGSHELLLRTRGEFRSVDDIAQIVVAAPGGVPVRLNEVAHVVDGCKEKRSISRLNGKECIIVSVRKQSGSNTVAVAQAIRRRMADLQVPEVTIRLSSDESEFIRDAKNDVMLSLVLGSLFASLVVFVSFGDVRNTLITVAGLPVCIVGAFAVIYFLGFSLNVITLLALSLSVGLLIDDAIVVRENIYRHMDELGKDAADASREGTAEVGLAVTATTLTIVAVFLPVAFATGIAGKFFREFGITVAAAVLISLFEAFTFAPMLSALFFKRHRDDGQSLWRRLMRNLGTLYDRLNEVYNPVLRWSLAHRKTVLALAVLLFAGSVALVGVIGTGGSPRGEKPEFNILLEFASGVNLAEADAVTRRYEEKLRAYPDISDLFTVIGSTDGPVDQAVLHVRIVPGGMRSRAFQDRVRPVLETIPGAKITFQEASSFSGAAASALTQLPIQINVRGNDLHAITQFAERLRDRLAGVPGLEDVNTNVRPARPEVQINVKRESAAQLGVSTTQVATVFRTFIGGDVVSKFRQGEKEIDIRLRLDERDRGRLDLLEGLSVPTVRGTTVMLSQVADVVFSAGPTQITRQNRARQIIVGGNIRQGRALGEVTADVQKVLSSMETPEGVVVTIGGQAEQMADSFKSLGVSLALAILFVYMVLASQFGSFLQPFTIMLALPLAVIGAFLALLLAGRPLDTMALIGLIMLMGLVTKNSILLIDYINRGRRGGLSRSEAIVEAGLKRLRPILMTSLAMILGMVPVAMAFGTSAEFRVSMGVTIIGGLISSTMLTLVVVPVVYTVLDDIVRRFRPAARPNLITE